MRRISYQYNLSDSKARGTPLLELVRAHTDELVFVWLRISGKNLLEAEWLALDEFFFGEIVPVTVSHSPEPVFCDLGSHIPVCWMDYEVRVPEPKSLVKGKVDLRC